MRKCFHTITLLLSLLSADLTGQQIPMDQRVRDSLFRLKPHATPIEQAVVFLETADLIKNELPVKSFSYIVSAFKISVLEKNDSLKAAARMKMGDYDIIRHRFMKAQEQYMTAAKIYQSIGDTSGQVFALQQIGRINRVLKNYEKALVYLQKGLNLVQQTKAFSLNGMIQSDIGLNYQSMNDAETAQYFFNNALTLFRQTNDKRNEFLVQNNIGSIYIDKGLLDKAMAFYTRLLEKTDSNDHVFLGILYTRLGHIHFLQKDYRISLEYNTKALACRIRLQSSYEINSSLINIAGDFYNLDKPDSGKLYLDSGLILARRFDRINLIENGYRHFYTYYYRQGDYKTALNYYAIYSSVKDEIAMEQYRNNVAILEANQQLQKTQHSGRMMARQYDIKSLNLKYHDFQSLILEILFLVASVFMLGFVLFFLYIRHDRMKMQELNIHLSDEAREREAAEELTRSREKQYRLITDNSIDFITQFDSFKNRIYASPASLSVYGYEPAEILKKSPYDLIHPNYHDYWDAMFREMKESRSSRQFTYQASKKDGTSFWVESILNPLFDPVSGDYKGMIVVNRDIQERKNKELEIMEGTKQKENLLKEIHHRVKNNFAILVSLINMQMGQTKNQELLQSLTNLQLRIRTMALVHEMLYRSGDFEKISFPGYLRSLASVIAGAYNRHDIELIIEADEVVMDIDALIPLGLIVNEILSNAYKHAFPGGRTGKIVIRFDASHPDVANTLVIEDNGIGMPDNLKSENFKSMGLQVVQILCAQIEGNLSITHGHGSCFTITFRSAEKRPPG